MLHAQIGKHTVSVIAGTVIVKEEAEKVDNKNTYDTDAAEKHVVNVVDVAKKPKHEGNCIDISLENCASEQEKF